MSEMIKVSNLQKQYGDHKVLKGISFQVKEGEVFALLGVNGAGKTTSLECIQGLRKYQGGNIELHGTIGVQLQSATLPVDMLVEEAATMFLKWQKVKFQPSLWEAMQMQEIAKRRYGTLSTGQKRRVHLYLALLHDPDILFLDEPTAGLDVEARYELHQQIRRIKAAGKTIVLASHDMQEVEELCDHIVILKDGHVALDTYNKDIMHEQQGGMVSMMLKQKIDFPTLPYVNQIIQENEHCRFQVSDVIQGTREILNYVVEHNIEASDLMIEKTTLETTFLSIAKERD